jgi:hypothetical protein
VSELGAASNRELAEEVSGLSTAVADRAEPISSES